MKNTLVLLLTAAACLAQQGPPPADRTIDAGVRGRVIDSLLKNLNEAYVFPETAAKMDAAIRERQKKGEYDSITSARDFARKLTDDLQAVSHDKHLRVNPNAPPRREGPPSAQEQDQFRRQMARMNYGFEKIERLPGNVGYLDLRGFMDASLATDTAAAAMNMLANSDALIVDLRQNGGGDPAMVAFLTTYLFGPEPVHLNDLYFRPTDETRQWWTLPAVPGKRLGPDKPVFVLTSKRTFSAAEEFTYNLKNLKRATIVGEATGGGAHPGGGRPLGDGFGAFVPTGRAINPYSKKNWEGDGVQPDVPVPADQALAQAKVLALEKIRDSSSDEEWKRALGGAIERAKKELTDVQAKN
jgi:hypothetical protein